MLIVIREAVVYCNCSVVDIPFLHVCFEGFVCFFSQGVFIGSVEVLFVVSSQVYSLVIGLFDSIGYMINRIDFI